jgi:hypothetical protein
LNNEIKKLVKGFRELLLKTFKSGYEERYKKFGLKEFELTDVRIFQAGNTCKAKWVESNFRKIFPEYYENDSNNNIIFVKDKNKNITPKNAVAIGALKLSGKIGVYNWAKSGSEKMPLDYNVGNRDEFDDSFEIVLEKGSNEKNTDWKELTIAEIDKGKAFFTIYYTISESVNDCDDMSVKHKNIIIDDFSNDTNLTVYIKPDDQSSIKYVLGNSTGDNLKSIDEKKIKIINLD